MSSPAGMQYRFRNRVFSSPRRNFRTSDTEQLLPRLTPYFYRLNRLPVTFTMDEAI